MKFGNALHYLAFNAPPAIEAVRRRPGPPGGLPLDRPVSSGWTQHLIAQPIRRDVLHSPHLAPHRSAAKCGHGSAGIGTPALSVPAAPRWSADPVLLGGHPQSHLFAGARLHQVNPHFRGLEGNRILSSARLLDQIRSSLTTSAIEALVGPSIINMPYRPPVDFHQHSLITQGP